VIKNKFDRVQLYTITIFFIYLLKLVNLGLYCRPNPKEGVKKGKKKNVKCKINLYNLLDL
jgi:hypothetical protein